MAASVVSAQDVDAGRVAYATPQVSDMDSCSASTHHALNPLGNQNRILNAADNANAIGEAIKTYARMAFLKNKLSFAQFAGLAAYIASPGAARFAFGSAITRVSRLCVDRSGSSSASQMFAIDNTGTAALLISGVSSSNPDFLL